MPISFPVAHYSSIGKTLLRFNDVSFTNASSRYLLDPLNKQVLGPFAGGTLATTTYQGRTYAQIEEARTNLFTYSQDLSHADWTKTRLETPTAATDPLGGSTAWKLIATTDDNNHYIHESPSPDGSSAHCFYVIAKAGEYSWIKLYMNPGGFVGTPFCYFDLGNGVKGTSSDCTSDMVDLGNGWWLCSIVATSDVITSAVRAIHVSEADNDDIFIGNGSDGLYVWNPQFELGAFPSSPIKTVAASVTRAKDQLYWAAALVPAAILSGRWACKLVPYWANDEANAYNMIGSIKGNEYSDFIAAGDKWNVYDAGVKVVASTAATFARSTLITLAHDSAAGEITLAGQVGGDGTHTGTPWAWSTGEDFRYGATNVFAYQFNGLITEPYAP